MTAGLNPRAAALDWVASVEPPGPAELGLLVHFAAQVGDESFSVLTSLKKLAKEFSSAPATISRIMRALESRGLVLLTPAPKRDGVYQAGQGTVVQLCHPEAPHMTPEEVAVRAQEAEAAQQLRAQLPEHVWEGLKPRRRHDDAPAEDDDAPTRPMIMARKRGGLRLFTAAPTDDDEQEQQRHAAP